MATGNYSGSPPQEMPINTYSTEKDPLLGQASKHESLYLRTPRGQYVVHDPEDIHKVDEMHYQPQMLLSWRSLLNSEGTVWKSRHLWATMAQLLAINFFVAVGVILAVPDPISLRIRNFITISYFLNFFVALLVGFFMTEALNRWHDCAEGFLMLGDSIRSLQMQLQALGATEEHSDLCARYGLLSGWLLKEQLLEEMLPVGEMREARVKMWQAFSATPGHTHLGCHPRLDAQELRALQKTSDPSGTMWSWISSLVARMAEDGEVPCMSSPTYGRIMNLAQDAHEGIRHVRASVSLRFPFLYVHMLASLVHINNILNAICLGLVLGITISGQLVYHGWHYYPERPQSFKSVEQDSGFCFVTFFVCTFGPFLYQAIVEISVALTQPFSSKLGHIPIERMLLNLEEDLADGRAMSEHTPHWEKPYFKKPEVHS